jgi:hypothetical protein
VQVGNIQYKCSGDNLSHTAPAAIHAEAGEGSFCCGMWKLNVLSMSKFGFKISNGVISLYKYIVWIFT